MMDKETLIGLFANLPQDRMLQALSAQGINIDPSLCDDYHSEEKVLERMRASEIVPWNDVRAPAPMQRQKPVFNKNKTFEVDKARVISKMPNYGAEDPMLAQYAAESNSQGGF